MPKSGGQRGPFVLKPMPMQGGEEEGGGKALNVNPRDAPLFSEAFESLKQYIHSLENLTKQQAADVSRLDAANRELVVSLHRRDRAIRTSQSEYRALADQLHKANTKLDQLSKVQTLSQHIPEEGDTRGMETEGGQHQDREQVSASFPYAGAVSSRLNLSVRRTGSRLNVGEEADAAEADEDPPTPKRPFCIFKRRPPIDAAELEELQLQSGGGSSTHRQKRNTGGGGLKRGSTRNLGGRAGSRLLESAPLTPSARGSHYHLKVGGQSPSPSASSLRPIRSRSTVCLTPGGRERERGAENSVQSPLLRRKSSMNQRVSLKRTSSSASVLPKVKADVEEQIARLGERLEIVLRDDLCSSRLAELIRSSRPREIVAQAANWDWEDQVRVISVVRNQGAQFDKVVSALMGLRRLQVASQSVALARSQPECLHRASQAAKELLMCDHAFAFLVDRRSRMLWTVIAWPPSSGGGEEGGVAAEWLQDPRVEVEVGGEAGEGRALLRMPLGVGIVGHVARTGHGVRIADPGKSPFFCRTVDNRILSLAPDMGVTLKKHARTGGQSQAQGSAQGGNDRFNSEGLQGGAEEDEEALSRTAILCCPVREVEGNRRKPEVVAAVFAMKKMRRHTGRGGDAEGEGGSEGSQGSENSERERKGHESPLPGKAGDNGNALDTFSSQDQVLLDCLCASVAVALSHGEIIQRFDTYQTKLLHTLHGAFRLVRRSMTAEEVCEEAETQAMKALDAPTARVFLRDMVTPTEFFSWSSSVDLHTNRPIIVRPLAIRISPPLAAVGKRFQKAQRDMPSVAKDLPMGRFIRKHAEHIRQSAMKTTGCSEMQAKGGAEGEDGEMMVVGCLELSFPVRITQERELARGGDPQLSPIDSEILNHLVASISTAVELWALRTQRVAESAAKRIANFGASLRATATSRTANNTTANAQTGSPAESLTSFGPRIPIPIPNTPDHHAATSEPKDPVSVSVSASGRQEGGGLDTLVETEEAEGQADGGKGNEGEGEGEKGLVEGMEIGELDRSGQNENSGVNQGESGGVVPAAPEGEPGDKKAVMSTEQLRKFARQKTEETFKDVHEIRREMQERGSLFLSGAQGGEEGAGQNDFTETDGHERAEGRPELFSSPQLERKNSGEGAHANTDSVCVDPQVQLHVIASGDEDNSVQLAFIRSSEAEPPSPSPSQPPADNESNQSSRSGEGDENVSFDI
uniref:GAF domain-containing protein n=1 Tax=Chromera velia CCMP2878 TaxID=1169474 RepID=A0A0G4GWD8_9ALVE|eukprot:Cvel_5312.t1-p1 / transcript=Cvel_5312.t1 / gene=Cvel_5312 / organism=Chromera_velia_CCMP2878 / gene_product=hypothetical protein / transcript_product=hypothetical protein / location=Cvel_scaffold246:41344-50415(-) / protein_length=1204 / sequence_SO=supercontig / SO=protein_coding / is_pseudo=false